MCLSWTARTANEDEARALHEFFGPLHPLARLGQREGREAEEVLAALVADLPVVEAHRPPIHLRLGHAIALVDQRRQYPRLAHRHGPEGEREIVVEADAPRRCAQLRQARPEGGRGGSRAPQRRDSIQFT
jgi:hypothetical protein